MPIYFLVFPFCVRGPGGFFFIFNHVRSRSIGFPAFFLRFFASAPPPPPHERARRWILPGYYYMLLYGRKRFSAYYIFFFIPYQRYYCCEYGRFYFRSLLAVQREMARVGRPTGTGGEKVMRNARLLSCVVSTRTGRRAHATNGRAIFPG